MQYNKHNDFEEFREDKHTAGIKKKKPIEERSTVNQATPGLLKGP